MKPRIKEVVVVEGRDDEVAVLAAVDACVICTSGYGIRMESLELIETACKRTGIVILTDPDHAGESIRRKLSKKFPEAKQAYIARGDASKDGDVGVENAPPAAIIKALEAALCTEEAPGAGCIEDALSREDLTALGLSGRSDSAKLRSSVGSILGIGSANAKTFLKRLRAFGISREELEKACESSRRERM